MLQEIGTKLLRQDKYQCLKTGEELPDAIKKLLGQEKDLRSQVLFTVADANASNASLKGMDMIAQIGLKNGWLFRSPEQAVTKYTNPKKIGKIEQLGALKSELEDLFLFLQILNIFLMLKQERMEKIGYLIMLLKEIEI